MPQSGPTSPFNAESAGILRWPGGEARCALGRSGVTPAAAKREGDGASPLGLWPMRQVFWRPDRLERPETGLPADPLIPEGGWCDDPASPFYNRPVVLPFPMSHEKLWREDHVYDVIVVLGYNDDPPVPGFGSAIFLHVARPDYSATEGCIACALPDLLALLKSARLGDALEIVS
ncbi:MAG: L,D-transpeptidase family protein [Hyphomonadaceae bacterium]